MSTPRHPHVEDGSHLQQQQQHSTQQQQVDPRLLLALPAPALRRVLQLASTRDTPALCTLCCVSKGLREAAEAAAPVMDITLRKPTLPLVSVEGQAADTCCTLSNRDTDGAAVPAAWLLAMRSTAPATAAAPTAVAGAASTPGAVQRVSLRRWLSRFGHRVRGLTVRHHGGPTATGHDLLLAMTSSAAAAGGIGGRGAAAPSSGEGTAGGPAATAAGAVTPVPVTAAAAAACSTTGSKRVAHTASGRKQATLPLPLERLHLCHVTLSTPLVNTLVKFDQLQVLVLTGNTTTMAAIGTQQQLLQALSNLKQLQKLALQMSQGLQQIPGDALLHSLPRRLAALDLKVQGGACSSSGLAPLVHLTSLRLHGVDLVSHPQPDEQQQGAVAVDSVGQPLSQQVQQQLDGLSLSQHHHHQQQQQQEPQKGKLCALSMRPTAANSWFAIPSVEALELVFDSWHDATLTQLAACPRLRQLRVLYDGHFPDTAGVSALTQLSRLRLETWALPEEVDVSSVGAELAALEQLQVLEVCYSSVEIMQPRVWLPQLRCLEKVVVLVSPGECHSLQGLQHLAKVISAWHNKSSSSSNSGGVVGGGRDSGSSEENGINSSSSGSSSSSLDLPQQSVAADSRLRDVELLLWSASGSDWKGAPPAAEYLQLQQAAADMAAALPWLQVTAGLDSYTCPCWTGEGEEEEEHVHQE